MNISILKRPSHLLWSLSSMLLFFLFVQCKNDSPEEINEEEVINKITLQFTDSENTTFSKTWNEGEAVPAITLQPNSSYQVAISFFDASDPADVEDITEEVIEEADEHLVFYEVTEATVSIESADDDTRDSAGVPLMINTVWETAAASTGMVRVYLIHEPSSKDGATRNAIGGSTDAELDFPVTIQ
ncbi:MAG: hypothetical protein ACPHUE_04630 [Flavobacteriaceae bacterium]